MVAEQQTHNPRKPRGRHPEKRLTSPRIRSAGPGRYADGNGLYLEVDATGARRWLLRTLVHGRRRDIGLGSVSLVSLAEARELAARLRKVARSGGDPIAERDKGKRNSLTFAQAAKVVHESHVLPGAKNEKHQRQWITTLETYAFPVLGTKPVHAVDQADILRVLAPIWTEKPETARRVRQRLRTVFDWALAAGHREALNPVEGADKGLPRQRDRAEHHTALPWQNLPPFMRRLEAVDGVGALALRLAILTAARSGEVRGATWDEIDLPAAVWTVPAGRMKMGREHRVPLSNPALEVLARVQATVGSHTGLVFASRRAGTPLSDMTLTDVLRRLEVPVTVHGFRSTFRDWAEETSSFPHEVKEAALAHTVKNKVEAAYRRTDLFAKRRQLMDAWGTYATAGTS